MWWSRGEVHICGGHTVVLTYENMFICCVVGVALGCLRILSVTSSSGPTSCCRVIVGMTSIW